MIKLINVEKKYYIKKNTVNALNGISVNLPDKGMIFLCGKSGCGKSTLLSILGTLDTKTNGEIYIDGKSIDNFDDNMKSSFRNNDVGFIFQENNLIDDLNVFDNISLSLKLKNSGDDKEISEIIKKIGLEGYEKRKANELSGGQKQRIAIARAIIKKPKMVLCDEPTGALDEENSKLIFKLLKEISKETLVVVASHDLESASLYGDGIIRLSDGKIIEDTIPACIEETGSTLIEYKKNSLPLKWKLKLGIKSLFRRPVRFIWMGLTLTLSLGIMGFMSIFSYTGETTFIKKAMKKDNVYYVGISKTSFFKDKKGVLYNVAGGAYGQHRFDEEDLSYFDDNFSGYEILYDGFVSSYSNFTEKFSLYSYVPDNNDGYLELNENDLTKFKFTMMEGRLPQNDNELCITDYQFSLFRKFGYKYQSKNYVISAPSDMINKKLTITDDNVTSYNEFNVVGVLNTSFDEERYSILDTDENDNLNNEFESAVHNGVNNSYIFNEGFFSRNQNQDTIIGETYHMSEMFLSGYRIEEISLMSDEVYKLNGFSENEPTIAVPYYFLFNTDFDMDLYEYTNQIYAYDLYKENETLLKNCDGHFESGYDYANFIVKNDYCDNKYLMINKEQIIRKMLDSKSKSVTDATLTINCPVLSSEKIGYEVKIGALTLDGSYYANDQLFSKLKTDFGCVGSPYKKIIFPTTNKNVYSLNNKKITDSAMDIDSESVRQYLYSQYFIDNEYSGCYKTIDATIAPTQKLMVYVLLGLFPLTAMMMLYFFSGVVLDSKKKIGVLRALGCSKKDSYMIFVTSGTLISLSISFLCCIIMMVIIPFEDNIVYKGVAPLVSYAHYNPIAFLSIIGLSFILVGIGLLVPLRKMVHMNPNDVIRSI